MISAIDCRNFEATWNEYLDAPDRGRAALDRHAEGCDECRALAARWSSLEQALESWGPVVPASPASLDRLRSTLAVPPRPVVPDRLLARSLPWAGIAAAALTLFVAGRSAIDRAYPAKSPWLAGSAPIPSDSSDALPLEMAFADATAMTWDLACEVSAPAARIGREALRRDDPSPGERASSAPAGTPDRPVAVDDDRPDPLSRSAHRAFGFLLGPDDPADPETPRS